MKLLYATDNIQQVDVGVFPGKLLKVASNVKLLRSGRVLSEIISLVCDEKATPDECRKLSVLDAKRIICAAWVNSYGEEQFEKISYCSCGKQHKFIHDVKVQFEADKRFLKAQTINQSVVKLRSPTIYREEELMRLSFEADDDDLVSLATDLMLSDCILSVNNEKPDFDLLPFSLIAKTTKIIKEEAESIREAFTEKKECCCGETIKSELNVFEKDFLIPSSLL